VGEVVLPEGISVLDDLERTVVAVVAPAKSTDTEETEVAEESAAG
jgi:large subunit ribosomal protein L25